MIKKTKKGKQTFILLGVLLVSFLSYIDSTVVSTAEPKIVVALNGLHYVSWIFTAYMLTSIICIPIFGKLSDMYGRKYFYIAGVVIFLAGSILCGMSTSMIALIVFRGVQGIGGGITIANSMPILADIYSPAERGKVQGYLGGTMGIASVIGPTVGGFLTDKLSWRWVFYVNVPFGIIAVIVLWFCISNDGSFASKGGLEKNNIDWLGFVLIIFTCVPLLLDFTQISSINSFHSIGTWIKIFIPLISLVLFINREKRAKEPIIPLDLFKNSAFSICVITGVLSMGILYMIVYFVPLLMQDVLGKTASISGSLMTFIMIGFVFANISGGQIVYRTKKYKILNIFGFLFLFIGMIMLTLIKGDVSNTYLIFNMCILGIGCGICMPISITVSQNLFPHSRVGVVSATLQFARNLGSTIGIAVFGLILNSGLKVESYALSLHNVFWVASIIALIGIIFSIFLKEIPLRDTI